MDRICGAYDFAAPNARRVPFDRVHEAFEIAIHDEGSAFRDMRSCGGFEP